MRKKTVTIIEKSKNQNAHEPLTVRSKFQAQSSGFAGQNILIVDDKKENLLALRKVLCCLDANIVEATSGNEALAATLEYHFAVALLDVMMPGMDGYELARHLRGDDVTKVLPLVFLTASYQDQQHMFKGYEAGGIDYLLKPFAPEVLLGKVRVFLELDRHRTQLANLVRERVKEQVCLCTILEILAKCDRTMHDALLQTIDVIPQGFQFPEITCARLRLDDFCVASKDIHQTEWHLTADIIIHNEARGCVEVFYTEQCPLADKNAFLKQEEELIVQIARAFGQTAERIETTAHIAHLNAVLQGIRHVNQLIVREKDWRNLIELACEGLIGTRGFRGAWIALTSGFAGSAEIVQKGFNDKSFSDLLSSFEKGQLPPGCRLARAESRVILVKKSTHGTEGDPLAKLCKGEAMLLAALEHNGHFYGFIGVCMQQKFAADEQEYSLLKELASDIAFALSCIDVEASLARSEKTLCSVFQNASDGIFVADMQKGRFANANPAMCRMLGYSAEEIVRLSLTDIHLGESLTQVREELGKLLRGEVTLASEVLVKRKDGTEFPADINFTCFELESQAYLMGIFRDITERKRAEEDRIRLMTAIQQADEAVILTDHEGTIRYVNPAFERMTGHSSEEALGENLTLLESQEHFEHFRDSIWRTLRQSKPWRGKLTCTARDGKRFTASATFSPVHDGAGRIANIVAVIGDTTKEDLLEKQLHQARKMEAVGQLAGGVAHDFNNILQAILVYTELTLQDLSSEDEHYEDLHEIHLSAKRASQLTRQLLLFSRKHELELQTVDLNELIEDLMKMLRRVIGEQVRLETETKGQVENIKADPGQIEQVIVNLCINARDAMPEGGKIVIKTESVHIDDAFSEDPSCAKSGNYVMLTVSDNGIGMTQDVQEHIFEPFFTTKGEERGTGLGLATVYGIVSRHKGHIDVYSELNEGTTFKVYLPVDAKLEKEEVNTGLKQQLTGTETVLVAEDEPNILSLVRRILHRNGYKVLLASDGEQALELLRSGKHDIDLVFLDVVMPGMNGRELYREIQKTSPEIPVLFTTGYSSDLGEPKYLAQKNLEVIHKPYGRQELLSKIRAVLRLRGRTR